MCVCVSLFDCHISIKTIWTTFKCLKTKLNLNQNYCLTDADVSKSYNWVQDRTKRHEYFRMENRRKEPKKRSQRRFKRMMKTATSFYVTTSYFVALYSALSICSLVSLQKQSSKTIVVSFCDTRTREKKCREEISNCCTFQVTLSPSEWRERLCHHNLAALHLKYFVGTINEWGNLSRFFSGFF